MQCVVLLLLILPVVTAVGAAGPETVCGEGQYRNATACSWCGVHEYAVQGVGCKPCPVGTSSVLTGRRLCV